MRLVIRPLILLLLASATICPTALGDLVLTSRDSSISVTGSFGNTANFIAVSNNKSESSTNSNFALTIGDVDNSSGDLGDIGWTSRIEYGNDQNIDVTSNSIQVGASMSLYTTHDDQGVAVLSAINQVTLIFQNTSSGLFQLAAKGINGNGQYRLEAFDGSQWNDLYNGLAGPIDLQFLMDAGTYRITANSFLPDSDNVLSTDSFNVTLSAVPEPGTLAALAFASATGYFYRRRSKRAV